MTKLNTIKIQYNKAVEKYNKELKELQENCNQCRSLCESSDYCSFDWHSWDENRYS